MSVVWEDFWLSNTWGVGDTTAPLSVFVSSVNRKISRVAGSGKESTVVTFHANEAWSRVEIRSGGVLIKGVDVGSWPGDSDYTVTIFGSEMVQEGNNLMKIFVRDIAGNWSADESVALPATDLLPSTTLFPAPTSTIPSSSRTTSSNLLTNA